MLLAALLAGESSRAMLAGARPSCFCVRRQTVGSRIAAASHRRRRTAPSRRPTFPVSTRATPSVCTSSTRCRRLNASTSHSPTSTSKESRQSNNNIIFTLVEPRQTARPTQCHIDTSVSQDSCTSRPRLPRRAAKLVLDQRWAAADLSLIHI